MQTPDQATDATAGATPVALSGQQIAAGAADASASAPAAAALPADAPAPQSDPNTHVLETPITRGTQTIDQVTLRKPKSGELRGASLADLVNLDVVALSKVLPRIATPQLTDQDVANMDPVDLVQLGGIFASFLMPKAVKSQLASQIA